MWKEVPVRKGGWVEFTSDKQAPSGAFLSGLGKVLKIEGDNVTVKCIYNGKMVVSKESCFGVLGGY